MKRSKDNDGQWVSAGDVIRFNYGIPPVPVRAGLIQRGENLIALTPGHKPAECRLRDLRGFTGGWFKENAQ